MLRKRLGWLVILFLAQFGTAEIIAGFEGHIAQVAILATFIPLIMSSGGNSGSQATTLVIRSLALREVLLGDWLRVLRRELLVGLVLGLALGGIGLVRVMFFPTSLEQGIEPLAIGLTLTCSVIGVVLWGTFSGSMLPFLLRRLGLDPASASAPLVATLVDLFGLLIYFLVAGYWLRDVLVGV